MTLKEIQIKQITELPKHQREHLKEKFGDELFNRHILANALVEISVSNSVPHIGEIELFDGTFSDRILDDVNDGRVVKDIFK